MISADEQDQDYCTPPWVVQDVVEAMGPIALDPCATRSGLYRTVLAETCLTVDDAPGYFSANWTKLAGGGLIYVNPEYGGGDLPSERWMERVHHWASAGETIVCLLRVSTGSKWWHKYVVPVTRECMFYNGRIKFWDPRTGKETHGNMHDSAMLLLGGAARIERDRFCFTMGKRGWVV